MGAVLCTFGQVARLPTIRHASAYDGSCLPNCKLPLKKKTQTRIGMLNSYDALRVGVAAEAPVEVAGAVVRMMSLGSNYSSRLRARTSS